MGSPRSAFLLITTVLALVAPATARVLRVPADAGTIESGLDLAQPGDTVRVSPGVYHESDLILPDGVSLMGDPDDPSAVEIDAAFAGRILLASAHTSPGVIEGLTFVRGLASGGGALVCVDAPVTIRRCDFRENVSGFDGGALVLEQSTARVEDCRFTANFASGGSGGALVSRRADAVIERCVFRGNDAHGWGGRCTCPGTR